jgi:uncharacterized membrane protein
MSQDEIQHDVKAELARVREELAALKEREAIVLETKAQLEQLRDQESLVFERAEFFGGPIPPPEMVRQYNDIEPGLGSRLVDSFVTQQDHRRNLEREDQEFTHRSIQRDFGLVRLGQLLAWSVVVIFAVLIWFAIDRNQPESVKGLAAAVALVITALAAIRYFRPR